MGQQESKVPEVLGLGPASLCRCCQLRLAEKQAGLMEMSISQSQGPPPGAALYFSLFFHQAVVNTYYVAGCLLGIAQSYKAGDCCSQAAHSLVQKKSPLIVIVREE